MPTQPGGRLIPSEEAASPAIPSQATTPQPTAKAANWCFAAQPVLVLHGGSTAGRPVKPCQLAAPQPAPQPAALPAPYAPGPRCQARLAGQKRSIGREERQVRPLGLILARGAADLPVPTRDLAAKSVPGPREGPCCFSRAEPATSGR